MLKPLLAVFSAFALLGGACSSQAHLLRLEKIWTMPGLKDPESVALSGDGRFLFVSNVNGEADARDGNGYISRVSLDGRMLQTHWADGLDAPKGLILKGDRLYAADITRLVELDAATGAVIHRYDAPGAKFLNDTAVIPDGTVLVSDSGTRRIYAFKDGAMTVWAEAPDLRGANGLYAEPGRLVVVTMGDLVLAMDYRTRAITRIASGVGDGDGIAPAAGGAYLASEWHGRLFEIGPGGDIRTLEDNRTADVYANDILAVGDRLYVPNMKPGALSAYRIVR